MQQDKLFQNGQSQAVRLPKEFRFEGDSVAIKRVGRAVVLLPYDEPWDTLVTPWSSFRLTLWKSGANPLWMCVRSFDESPPRYEYLHLHDQKQTA